MQVIFEPTAGFTLENTCATPTVDSDGVGGADGSGSVIGANMYQYDFSGTVTGPVTLHFCVNVTSPAAPGSYSARLTDDNGAFGAAMYYVGGDNDVFVIVNVAPTLSFNIRNIDDTADTNSCTFGTVSTSTVIPNYDDVIDLDRGECGYSLAVGTNAVGGFQTQIIADGPLSSGIANIANIANGGTFVAGIESYGFASITPSTKGRNPANGLYTESVVRDGNFNLTPSTSTSIPVSLINFISYSNGVQYSAGVDASDVTKIIHGLVVGAGTPAGYYDQVITYTTTANY
jgi:hypothetical protein